jgi:hypothetical protein
MAHKKGQGSSRNGRDSNPKYRGVKLWDGQVAPAGSILVRQLGSKFHAVTNVGHLSYAFCRRSTIDCVLGSGRQRMCVILAREVSSAWWPQWG